MEFIELEVDFGSTVWVCSVPMKVLQVLSLLEEFLGL